MTRLPPGVGAALLAALLFGGSTPLAKLLLNDLPPVLLAGLLYLGSGVGLALVRLLRRSRGGESAPLGRRDLPWLAGAIAFGGVLGPVLLMVGLRTTPASTASLLLNLEGVLTAFLAWFAFRENFDRRIALGMALIVAGGLVLSWQGSQRVTLPAGALAVAAACLCWAIDNNLTQKVSAADPMLVASLKGLVSGLVNTSLAVALGSRLPGLGALAGALVVGLVGYGISLALFVLALRQLGTARTGAYFSVAPFLGAAVSIVLVGEPVTPALLVAATLMGAGVWLHLTERHEHEHRHQLIEHSHRHVHDEHHRHSHAVADPVGEPHTHPHVHEPVPHRHPHYPDIHHRHPHGSD